MTTNYSAPPLLRLSERLYPSNLFKLLLIGLLLMSLNPAMSQINATFVGQSPTCPQGNDGSLCCTSITGGIPPYNCSITFPSGTYNYNSITNCFTNMSSGSYTILITDNFGNSGSVNTIVPPSQYPPIVINTTITNATCGQSNGSACCTVTGGTGNYTYQWIRFSDFQILGTSLCLNNLSPNDSYSFTVYDAGSPCFGSVQIIVPANNLALSAVSTNTSCPSPNCNGSIDVTVNGTAPYTYSWTGPGGFTSSTEDLAGLCPGTYTVNVTDANGCIGAGTYTINTDGADVVTGGLGNQANVITGNIVWNPAYFNGQTTIIVDADVIVNAGVNLSINNLTVLVTPGHSIEGLVTSKIFGNNSTFDVICGDTWRGFEIHGGGVNNEFNRAELELLNCQILHAECGIRNHNQYGTSYLSNTNNFGGRITCDQTRFIDNVYDLNIGNYFPLTPNNTNYSSRVNECEFILNQLPAVREQANGNDLTILQSNARIIIGNSYANDFSDIQMDLNNPNYSNTLRTKAISLAAAKMRLNGINPGNFWTTANYTSRISGYYIGINAVAPGPMSGQILPDLELLNTQFNCHQGVIGQGNINVIISNNRFDPYTNPLFQHIRIGNATTGQHCAIYLLNNANVSTNAAMSFLIAHNRIQNSLVLNGANGIVRSYGIQLSNTAFIDNFIVENEIHNCLDQGLRFLNRNRQGGNTNQTQGVHYECNIFVNNTRDVNIEGANSNDGIAPVQGQFYLFPNQNRSAGNNFTASTNALANDDVNTSTGNTIASITYRYNNAEISNSVVEMTTTLHTPVPREFNPCGLPFPSIAPNNPPNQTSFNQYALELSAKQELLAAMIDDGDTYGTITLVEMANYTQAYTLYQELIQISPSVSEEVLIASIQKEFELPKPLLTLILAANPHAAKSSAIREQLDQRMDPLDAYQKEQIDAGKYALSPMEMLQLDIAGLRSQIKCHIDELRFYGVSLDAYWQILALTNDQLKPLSIEAAVPQGEYEWAISNLANQIEDLKLYYDDQTLLVWRELMQIRNQAQINGLPLSASSVSYLHQVQDNNSGNLSLLANEMLHVYCNEELIVLEEHDLRSEESNSTYEHAGKENIALQLWPNPADTFITIKAPINKSQQHVQILNTTGQLVWTGELEPLQSEMVIAIDEIQSGLYHLLITSSQGSQSSSFYKK